MKERKVRVLIGLPGSGKSTWALEWIKKNSDWVRVNRDDFRFMLKDAPVLEFKVENMITKLVMDSVKTALMSGYNVILDNTHCRLRYINDVVSELGEMADIEFQYFDVPAEVCIKRDQARERSVGEAVIRKMDADLNAMLREFDFMPVKRRDRVVPNYMEDEREHLETAVIFDIDGTLAHMNGKRGPFDWKKVGRDDVDEPMRRINHAIANDGRYTIIMVSGRDSVCREETIAWLQENSFAFDHLFMRPENDFRKDSLIKKEIYENEIRDRFNVMIVFDDRDQVVKTWRDLGLKCAQVEPGLF